MPSHGCVFTVRSRSAVQHVDQNFIKTDQDGRDSLYSGWQKNVKVFGFRSGQSSGTV